MRDAPLHGCRVIDLGIITAGAATSALLADLGAEVIKIESPHYRDPFRVWKSVTGEPPPKGMPPFFAFTNRGKRGVSLDLKHPDGHAAFLRLVRRADVVVENFRRGVLDRLEIGIAALRAVNPGIILASISSQGDTGPDASYVSFGTTLEAVGGLACQTGYVDGRPVVSGHDVNYPDQVVAIAFPRSPMIVANQSWDLQHNSGGRFVLGLGSQVRAHDERRFSVPWISPAPRLAD
jgi:crotonobetainyl-CoA:carnitine CoA-transferase CaiB-like acyl-CoA transferase